MKNYSIGLDIGTSSVGWAVVDNETFKVIKKGNKRQSLWGVRLFDEASSAENRRNYRSTRRRYARRKQRIKLLQELFQEEINKVDPNFYQKLNDSFYSPNDLKNKKINLTEFDKEYIFNNNQRKNKEKTLPTIYHLRDKLMNSTEKADIRSIYLAIHHIIKYRGNFLYTNDNFNINNLKIREKLKEIFEEIDNLCKETDIDIEGFNDEIYAKLEKAILSKSLNDKKSMTKEILNQYINSSFSTEFATKLITGNQFSLSKLFNIKLEEDIKISFKGSEYDDNYLKYEKVLGDKISILELCKELYDMIFLKNLFGSSQRTNLSGLMVERYNKHRDDLVFLKKLLKYDKKIYKDFFKDTGNDTNKQKMCIYTKYINNKITYDELIKEINKVIEKILDYDISIDIREKYNNKVKYDIENGTFLPRITSTDNGKYPYQLNKDELIKIIENQGKYYKFLLDSVCINGKNKYKLIQLLEFRIPYYVGPLNNNTCIKNINNKNAWIEKKENYIRITPFNFDEVIDKETTAEKFIKRMIANCTYLINEKAIPANSILYSKYKVLNELKQITINNAKIPIDLQHKIYEELFLTTDRTITEKIFINYIRQTREYAMYPELLIEGYSDNKKFANSMKSYYDFFGQNGIFNNTKYNVNDAEEIIKWITIFEDKEILENKVRNNYPDLNNNQIQQIITKKYTGWSNLSKKLLTDITTEDKITKIPKSIIDLMWETPQNFMQILFNKEYQFQEKIAKLNMIKDVDKVNYSLVENLATSPAIKKGIYQALKIVEEIVNYVGYKPTNIMIEMARNEEKKERKDNRKEYLKKIYSECKKDVDAYLIKELNSAEKIDTEKLFLYFIQLGRSMYSMEPLNINELQSYEVDHIIPRTLIKDDSIDNKVLVKKEENQIKAANFVLPENFRNNQMITWWRHLKDINLISAKKFNNLCRNQYTEKDIEGFINRQLVETRQITKHVANILNNLYKDTNIIYLHADLSSNYREKFELFKYRDLNDYHHAHDAYLACILGIYQKKYLKKTTDFSKLKELNKRLYNEGRFRELKYGYVINSIDNEVGTFNETTGEILFDAEYFNNTAKNTLYQNDILISKKTEIKTGEFYKETIYKKNSINAKYQLKSDLSTELYGGYTSCNYSYIKLIEYTKNHKKSNILVGIPVLLEKSKDKNTNINNYIINNLKCENFTIKKDRIPFNIEILYKNQLCNITGCGIGSSEIVNATEFKLDKEKQIKYKYLLNFIFNEKYPNKNKYIFNEKNNNGELTYNEFINCCNKDFDILINNLFKDILDIMHNEYPLYENIYQKLLLVVESNEFENLPFVINLENEKNNDLSKVIVIKEIFKLLKANSTNANLEKLNKTVKFSDRVGRINGVNIQNAIIVNKSVTGLKERRYEF